MTDPAPRTPAAAFPSSRYSLLAAQLCVGLVPLLIFPRIEEFSFLPKLLFVQLATLGAALAWAFGTRTLRLRHSPLHLPAVALFLMLAASVFWALNPFRATYALSKHLSFLIFFIVLLHTLDRTHISAILRASAVAGVLVSLLGIGEYLGFVPHWIPSTGRPSSTFGFRNLAAFYLVANLPLAGLLFLTSRRPFDRWLGALSAAFMFVFLLYTRARGSWVGLFAATLLSFGLWALFARKTLLESIKTAFDRPALIVAACTVLLVGVLGPLPEGFRERHTQRFDEKKADVASAVTSIFETGGDRGRFLMWRQTLEMIRRHPLLGVGLGNWEYAYPFYDDGQMVRPDYSPLRPHNDLLWIWSETGPLGLLSYLALLITCLLLTVRIWGHASDPQDRLAALACSITVFAVVGAGCFSFPWERIPPSMLFWLALAILGILARSPEVSSAPIYRSMRQTRAVVLLIPPLLLTGLGITVRHIGFDYYYVRTAVAFLKKDSPAIVQEAARAIPFGPFNHQIFIMYGEGHLNLENYDLAEQSFRRCLTYHPNFANTYSNLGFLYDRLDRTDDAFASYRKALEIVPKHHVARYNLGTLYQRVGQIDSAIVTYRRAFRTSYTTPYVNLGVIYHEMGLLDSVIAVSQYALSADPPPIEAYINLGRAYADKHEYEKATDAYRSFLTLYKGESRDFVKAAQEELAGAYSGLGIQAQQRGQDDRAVEIYKTALKLQPDSPIHWYNLGNAYRKKKAWNGAVHAFLESLARDTTYVYAYNNLGKTYQDLGQFQKAVDTYRKALQFQPDQPILYHNLGDVYTDLGNISAALKAYDAFLKHWTEDPFAADAVRKKMEQLKRR